MRLHRTIKKLDQANKKLSQLSDGNPAEVETAIMDEIASLISQIDIEALDELLAQEVQAVPCKSA